ncbi:MAG TPA: alpha-L-arabinofuranosidase C-terminal domain-containing protein, partial [Acidobacteriaceae bacterium]|nr:alpha-L-arabinofuranosidase C-terminal domain-containing protein [Acidobacteriaceae bacterium]
RAFTDNRRAQPFHWFIYEAGDSDAQMTIDTSTGPSAALPLSLALTVRSATPAAQAGIANEGYWGIAVRPNTVYQGSFYAKAADPAIGPITVSLRNSDTGSVLAVANVPALTSEWKQYQFTLRSDASAPSVNNRLVLTAGKPGTVWFSMVSLFPPTYHDRVNGNRADLMEKLAAMHPAFLRFPGGNYLEGDHVSDRFPWQKTLGPLVDRPTHPSPWNYLSSDGMGLLEFLEWCEDLKIEPVLAVYAGYSLKQDYVQPGRALEPYVAEALDELEYVTGSTGTRWGAERARDGHPEPFKLTYVEIGNEDNHDRSGTYDGRFTQFYKAIKAKYPELQLIATTPVKGVRPDVIDDHYYHSAQQFYDDVGHYDKTDRQGPKIFIGEWATREGSPTPNFNGALGDAAWMTGMERNSDIIVMSCYAPLFVNVNPGGMQWESDLIGYNAMSSYGSPSYYAQVMFSNHVGDQILRAKLDGSALRFFYSATRGSKDGKVYLKLVNATSSPRPLNIRLDGVSAANLNPEGKVISLSAERPEATNTILEPQKIVPVERTVSGVGPQFSYTVPPYSIQVLQLSDR